MDRRQIIRALGAAGAGTVFAQTVRAQTEPPFKLPPLGYAYEALEPHIDTATMRIHHTNHHAAYVANLNNIAGQLGDVAKAPMEQTLANLSSVPEAIRGVVRNNLGGHWNHTYFWELMTPGGPKEPTGDLEAAIDGAFGDLAKFQERLAAAALGRFGSGWAWLAVDKDKKLAVFNTPYQDTPHMEMQAKGAVIGIDVWEHAYYLKHQSRRADYVKAWWNVVNWDKASANFKKATA
ncbi:superoxide dismutase [Terrarubrum flagellatum]|uniref:superoxide dismutase n=1 Tax=Terrirubrum flagellatum TaxID=2895980 RepID=UPI0031451D89